MRCEYDGVWLLCLLISLILLFGLIVVILFFIFIIWEFCKCYVIGLFVLKNKYKWVVMGDVNVFFGLMLDNVVDLLLIVFLLVIVFEFFI